MESQYDAFAREYNKVEGSPLRRHVESFSFFKALGSVTGKGVLDVGCGSGIYTRRLKQGGASHVIGLDISREMLEAARALEGKDPLGIEYVLEDAANAMRLGSFDVVTAVYVLPHAASKADLLGMCRGIYGALRPGGRFVAVPLNPELTVDDPSYYERYGFTISTEGDLRDGGPVKVEASMGIPGLRFTIAAHYWSKETCEWALREAGFTSVTWRSPEVSPEGIEEYGEELWRAYLAHPHAVVLNCMK